jgi:hypothetical protein
MMKIPFDRCLIVTTLDFDRILDRLESAIYDSRFEPSYSFDRSPRKQRYYGEIRGFKFSATRTIGHKYVHLPSLFLPTIEGTIDQLHNGYEISLKVALHNWTCLLLLGWLGGLVTFVVASMVDNVLGEIQAFQYLNDLLLSFSIYLAIVAYFYFAAWRGIKFFKSLFAQRLLTTSAIVLVTKPKWQMDLQYQQATFNRTAVDWMRVNLPSLPSSPVMSRKMSDRRQRKR